MQTSAREYGPADRQIARAALAHRTSGSMDALHLSNGTRLEGAQLAAVLDGFARARRFSSYNELPPVPDINRSGAFESMTCLCPNCPLRGMSFLHVFKSAGSVVNTVSVPRIDACSAVPPIDACFATVRLRKPCGVGHGTRRVWQLDALPESLGHVQPSVRQGPRP